MHPYTNAPQWFAKGAAVRQAALTLQIAAGHTILRHGDGFTHDLGKSLVLARRDLAFGARRHRRRDLSSEAHRHRRGDLACLGPGAARFHRSNMRGRRGPLRHNKCRDAGDIGHRGAAALRSGQRHRRYARGDAGAGHQDSYLHRARREAENRD